MVGVQVRFTTGAQFLILTLMLGTYADVTPTEVGPCSLIPDVLDSSNVLDCSSRELYSVPPIDNISGSFPLIFNLSSNYISIDTGDVFSFIYNWPDHRLYVSELYLDHNRIQQLPPETLNPVRRATVVDLSWNQMEKIPDKLFSYMADLKRLSLAGNPISELNITLPPSIEELNMSSCNLSLLGDRVLAGLANLSSLDISNNQLVSVDWSVVNSVTTVRMEGNPWDCSLLWQKKPELARAQERCATTTTAAVTGAVSEASTSTERPQSAATEPPEEILWSSFGIVEGVLVGWLVYFLLLGSAAWLRARSLQRDLARHGNWWTEPRF